MSKRRKSSKPDTFSVESLRDEAEKEVNQEVTAAKILNDLGSIKLDAVENVPVVVILCALIVKFEIKYNTLNGTNEGIKVSLKCNKCSKLYGYAKFGNPTDGRKLYPESRSAVEASDVCFVDRSLLKWQISLVCHSWVSFNGFSEAYNEVHKGNFGEKQVAAAFWNGELENELRELGVLDFFGKLRTDKDREEVMTEIDKIRAKTIYEHPQEECSDVCKER
ncbi:Hypothetical predicted protein, partial [Paramuricea clavata]